MTRGQARFTTSTLFACLIYFVILFSGIGIPITFPGTTGLDVVGLIAFFISFFACHYLMGKIKAQHENVARTAREEPRPPLKG